MQGVKNAMKFSPIKLEKPVTGERGKSEEKKALEKVELVGKHEIETSVHTGLLHVGS